MPYAGCRLATVSDVFPGEGWWMASDGKWYAPQLHHDPAYRAKYATPAPVELDETPGDDGEQVGVESEELEEATIDSPEEPHDSSSGWVDEAEVVAPEPASTTGGMPPPVVKPAEPAATATDVAPAFSDEAPPLESIRWPDLPDTQSDVVADTTPDRTEVAPAEPSTPTLESAAEESDSVSSDEDDWVTHGPTVAAGSGPVTVAPPTPEPASVKPAFETKRPPSVVGQAPTSRARLEVGRSVSEADDRGSSLKPSTASMSPRPRSTPTQSESGLTEIRVYKEPAELVDRAIAAVLFLSGLTMIVGTFVDWISEAGADTTGWERGDGIATVFAGVFGAAAAGPIFVGFRHIVPKTVAIVCGLIGAVVVGLVGLDVTSDSAAAATSLAPGFWLTLAGSMVMIVAGVAERTSIR